MKKDLISLGLIVLVGVLSRLIPHPWNFTGVTAMAIISGVLFKKNKFLFVSPLLALFISDLLIGFHETMLFTYLGFAVVGLLSLQILSTLKLFSEEPQNYKKYAVLGGSSLVGSLLFFMISNFGVWLSTGMYSMTYSGLVECYIAGIPFLFNQVTGDLFYMSIFTFALNFSFSKKAAVRI